MPKPTKVLSTMNEGDAEEIVDTNSTPPKERPYRDYCQEIEPLSRHGGGTDSGMTALSNLANLSNLGGALSASSSSASSNTTGHGFPVKLYDALLALDAAGMSRIACFQPHGRAFRVLQPQAFVSSVLSTYE
jgi:hypothetical protein